MVAYMGARTTEPAEAADSWWLMILVAAAPLVVTVGLLQLLGASQGPLASHEIEGLHRFMPIEPFLPGGVSYVAVLMVHVFVCGIAIWIATGMLRPLPDRKRLMLAGGGLGIAIAGAMPLLASRDVAASRLSYYVFRDLYEGTGAGTVLLARGVGSLTRLDVAILLPIALGVVAVTLMAAAATGQYRLLTRWVGDPHADEETRLCIVHTRLKRCLYALTFVLITGTVSASWFVHLPTRLYLSEAGMGCCFDVAGNTIDGAANLTKQNAELLGELRARLADYAGELSILWGGVFTLTLAAAVGLPMLLVQRKLNDFVEGLKPPKRAQQVRSRLAEAGLTGKGGEQIKVALAFVAPLASGPIANFLQAAASG